MIEGGVSLVDRTILTSNRSSSLLSRLNSKWRYTCANTKQHFTLRSQMVGRGNLWLDEYQVDELHYEIVLNVFVGKTLAPWTLSEPDTFT